MSAKGGYAGAPLGCGIILKFIRNDGGLVRNPVLFRRPSTQIDQLAALTAEGSEGVGFSPLHGFLALGTINNEGLIALLLHDAL